MDVSFRKYAAGKRILFCCNYSTSDSLDPVLGWNQRQENITVHVILLLEKPVVLPNICKLKQYIKSCVLKPPITQCLTFYKGKTRI